VDQDTLLRRFLGKRLAGIAAVVVCALALIDGSVNHATSLVQSAGWIYSHTVELISPAPAPIKTVGSNPPDAPALTLLSVRFAGGTPLQAGPLNLEWRIINSGKSDAVISETKTTPLLLTGPGQLPSDPIYPPSTRTIKGLRVIPGVPLDGATVTPMSLSQDQVGAIKNGASRLYYYGYFKYGQDSEFAFISVYDPRVGMFTRDDDEYPAYSRSD
jgi:hypothetical protein